MSEPLSDAELDAILFDAGVPPAVAEVTKEQPAVAAIDEPKAKPTMATPPDEISVEDLESLLAETQIEEKPASLEYAKGGAVEQGAPTLIGSGSEIEACHPLPAEKIPVTTAAPLPETKASTPVSADSALGDVDALIAEVSSAQARGEEKAAVAEIPESPVGVTDPMPTKLKAETTKRPEPALKPPPLVDPEQMKKDVRINVADLDNCMIEHPALYVHYAERTVRARRILDRAKNNLEIVEARLDNKYREAFSEQGKKATEPQLRAAVVQDQDWLDATEKVTAAAAQYRLCEVAESAMNQRKDLMLEIARDRRKEREGQLRVYEQDQLRGRVLDQMRGTTRAA